MKKLLITSTDVMMIQFIVPHVIYLKEHGFYVDVACSSAAGYQNENYLNKIQDAIGKDSHVYSVRTERSPYTLGNRKGYSDLCEIIKGGGYEIVWTNEPVMGVMTRLACRKARKNKQLIKDFVIDRQTGYSLCPYDVDGFKNAIQSLIDNSELRQMITKNNVEYVKKYEITESTKQVYNILKEL